MKFEYFLNFIMKYQLILGLFFTQKALSAPPIQNTKYTKNKIYCVQVNLFTPVYFILLYILNLLDSS